MKSFRILIGIMMFVLAVSLCVSSIAEGAKKDIAALHKKSGDTLPI
jgi:hypothetical protein